MPGPAKNARFGELSTLFASVRAHKKASRTDGHRAAHVAPGRVGKSEKKYKATRLFRFGFLGIFIDKSRDPSQRCVPIDRNFVDGPSFNVIDEAFLGRATG